MWLTYIFLQYGPRPGPLGPSKGFYHKHIMEFVVQVTAERS